MQYKKNFDKVKLQIAQNIENALNEIGGFVVAESQIRTPVDTGNLRRGETFKVDADNKAVHVGSNVEYDEYVELGTSKQSAQPHWKPAVYENISDITNIAKKHLKKVGE